MKSKGAIMKTSGKIELGRRRAVWELPAELANLHHKVSIGSSCFLKLAPRPSKHWDARRAAELAVGAGFTLDKPCFFRSQIAFLSVTKIESLPDSVGPEMQTLMVGLNPSPYSSASRVPYGRPGNRFWPAAHRAGLISKDRDIHHALVHHGIGFTDLVRRTTRRAGEIDPPEFRSGFERVKSLIEWLKPKVVCFVGLSGWRIVSNPKAKAGIQPASIGLTTVYVMPHPSGLNAHASLKDLIGHFSKVRELNA